MAKPETKTPLADVHDSRDEFYQRFRIPNPESLKWASTRGGYTTIIAQYQIEKCTKIWGPYGTRWGLRNLKWSWIQGKDVTPVYVQLECEFFWSESELDNGGSFEMSTGWAFDGKDSDVLKKVQTDAISKSLSKLGIDSDVFKGLWAQTLPADGVVYVGDHPARDIPRAKQDRIVYLEDKLFPKCTENVSKGFEIKLNDLNWNYLAVEAVITKLEKHLEKETNGTK